MRILAPLALTALLAGSLAAQPADATIDRAVTAYKGVKTLRGSFEQTVVNPLTGTTLHSSGTFQQRRPGRLAVRFTNPKGDAIVADGRSVWVYLPSTTPGQVIRMPLGEGTGSPVDLVEQLLTTPRADYSAAPAGQATVSGHATHAVTITPTAGSRAFSKATVWVDDDDGLVRKIAVTEPSGLQRTVTLTTLKVNAKLDTNAFTFVPPRGVKVYDQTGR